jgi:hypothetical protein
MTWNAADRVDTFSKARHARPCAGHPRLDFTEARKTWMAGSSPAMTKRATALRIVSKRLSTVVPATEPGPISAAGERPAFASPRPTDSNLVMLGLVPGIHVFATPQAKKDVDGRDEARP